VAEVVGKLLVTGFHFVALGNSSDSKSMSSNPIA
jgi:hypothetical protein